MLPGRTAGEAVELLKFIPRKAARMLDKTLRSAMANAENNANLSAEGLVIREAIVEQVPAKRSFSTCFLSDSSGFLIELFDEGLFFFFRQRSDFVPSP